MMKIIFSITMLLMPLSLFSNENEIDGIEYDFIDKGGIKEAIVLRIPNLDEVIIPEKVLYENEEFIVTIIGQLSCTNNAPQRSIKIPKSIKKIEKYAFVYNEMCFLNAVHIYDLNSWMNIDFEDDYSNPLKLAKHLYLNGEEVHDVLVPESFEQIKDYTFQGLNFNSVTIPSSLKTVGLSAFSGGAKEVYISDLKKWCEINFAGVSSNPLFRSDGGRLYCEKQEIINLNIPAGVEKIKDYTFLGCQSIISANIPNGVTSIGDEAFRNCINLKSIIMPNSLNTIGQSAFQGCSSLLSIDIPYNVTNISRSAFSGCSGLTSLTIPNSITSIEGYAFSGCSGLTSVTIPNSVTSIGECAFYGCKGIKDFYCNADEVPITSSDAFNQSYPEYITLHVPAASIETYRSTAPWSQFKTIVALESGDVPEIKKCATPEISFDNGRVKFTCETEGVDYISSVTLADEHNYYDDEIQLSQTYKITVYATKAGYENSDITTREIVIKSDDKAIVVGDVDGDGKVNVADHVKLSDIILNK